MKPFYFCEPCQRAVEPTLHDVLFDSENMHDRPMIREAGLETRCPHCCDVVEETFGCIECGIGKPEEGCDHSHPYAWTS